MIMHLLQSSFSILLSLQVSLFPLANKISPLVLTPGTTTSYGSYMAETYKQSTGGGEVNIGLDEIVSVTIPFSNNGQSVFHFAYNLKQKYTGSITITPTTYGGYVLNECTFACTGGWFSTIPSLTSTAKSKAFTISFVDSDFIEFIIVSDYSTVFGDDTTFTLSFTQTTNVNELSVLQNIYSKINGNFDYKLSNMNDTLNNMILAIQQSGNIDYEMLPAWVFMLDANLDIAYDNDLYPRIMNTSGTLTSRTTRFYPGEPIYFYYVGSTSGHNVTFSNSAVTMTWERINAYSISGASVMRVEIEYTGTNTAGVTGTLSITQTTGGWVIPIYYGNGVGMSDRQRSVLGLEDPNTTYLSAIFDLLSAYFDSTTIPDDPNRVNTVPYDNAVRNLQQFVYSVETLFGSGISLSPTQDLRPDIINAIDNVDDEISSNVYLIIPQLIESFYAEMVEVIPGFGLLTVLAMSVMLIGVFR